MYYQLMIFVLKLLCPEATLSEATLSKILILTYADLYCKGKPYHFSNPLLETHTHTHKHPPKHPVTFLLGYVYCVSDSTHDLLYTYWSENKYTLQSTNSYY